MTTRLDATKRGLDPTTVCTCVAHHVPQPSHQALNVHHIVPRSWGGPDAPGNRVTICATTHANVHALLNEYVRAAPTPPAEETLRRYPRYARALAARAVAEITAGGAPVPHIFTVDHPEGP